MMMNDAKNHQDKNDLFMAQAWLIHGSQAGEDIQGSSTFACSQRIHQLVCTMDVLFVIL